MTIEAPPQRGPGGSIFFMDLIRGVASQLVVVGHSINTAPPSLYMVPGTQTLLEAPRGVIYIQNFAVLIFFYVSGYLITGTFVRKSRNPEWRLRHFLADRAARIFTPLVPLLLVLYVTDNLVFGPPAIERYVGVDASLDELALNLTMLFDNPLVARVARWLSLPWLAASPFGSADQLWTIVIEWWIYVVFGLAAFWLIRRRGNPLLWSAALAFALVVPAAAMIHKSGLIVAWLVGMGMCLGHDRLRRQRPALLAAIAATALAGATARWALTAFNFYDPLTAGLLGIALFTFMTWREGGRLRVLPAWDALVAGMSNISYSLYLVHLTVIVYVAEWLPSLIDRPWAVALSFVLCNLVAILFYLLFERHYPRVRKWMEPWLGRRRTGGALLSEAKS